MQKNATMHDIISEIEGDVFESETLEFLASFIDYCNIRTTWGVPCMHSPLDSDMLIEWGVLTVRISDIARETSYRGYSNECFFTIEETDKKYRVGVTSYLYDEELDDIYPSTYFPTTFDIATPYDLEQLCHYVGITYQPSYFA